MFCCVWEYNILIETLLLSIKGYKIAAYSWRLGFFSRVPYLLWHRIFVYMFSSEKHDETILISWKQSYLFKVRYAHIKHVSIQLFWISIDNIPCRLVFFNWKVMIHRHCQALSEMLSLDVGLWRKFSVVKVSVAHNLQVSSEMKYSQKKI